MPQPIPQQVTISNPGPNAVRVTGGTAGTPVVVPAFAQGQATVGVNAPLVIELLDGDGLGGGHGEG